MSKAHFYHSHQSWQSLLYAGGIFALIYNLTNAYAQIIDGTYGVPHIANTFDKHTPFIAPMIVPYALSMPLFVISFFIIDRRQLSCLTHRLLLLTIISGLIFYYFPLKFSLVMTDFYYWGVDWSWAYQMLFAIDKPYNQLPSLHVGFAMLIALSLYSTLKSWCGLYAWLLVMICFLIAISTIFTYQHHSYDLLAGLICALLVYCIEHYLSSAYTAILKANIIKYISLAVVWLIVIKTLPVIISQSPITGIASLIIDFIAYHGLICFLLVAFCYHRYKKQLPDKLLSQLFHKQQGRFTPLGQFIFMYFYAMYYLLWQLAKYSQFLQTTHKPIKIDKHTDILAIGRLPKYHYDDEFFNQYEAIIWLDISTELSCHMTGSKLADKSHYIYLPMLDLSAYQDCHLTQLIQQCQFIQKKLSPKRTLIVCQCAMGHSRSVVMMAYLLAYMGKYSANNIYSLIDGHYPKHRAKKYIKHKHLTTIRNANA